MTRTIALLWVLMMVAGCATSTTTRLRLPTLERARGRSNHTP